MLQVKNLGFSYGGTQILKDISFEVKAGELCGLFGPNGSGKTTLFKCCMNLLRYDKGSVLIDGKDIKYMGVEEMAKVISYVPQEHKPPFPYLVKEVVLMGRTPYMGGVFGVSPEDRKIAAKAMDLLEIRHLADKPYTRLSIGQRQLVLIARAVAQDTRLMLLDEPTSALDFSNQIRIWNILKKISARGTTIIACSHDPNHISWFCDTVVVMCNGTLVARGRTESIISEFLLNRIYPGICCVGYVDRMKMIFPKSLNTSGLGDHI